MLFIFVNFLFFLILLYHDFFVLIKNLLFVIYNFACIFLPRLSFKLLSESRLIEYLDPFAPKLPGSSTKPLFGLSIISLTSFGFSSAGFAFSKFFIFLFNLTSSSGFFLGRTVLFLTEPPPLKPGRRLDTPSSVCILRLSLFS